MDNLGTCLLYTSQSKGIPIINLLEIEKEEKVNSIIAISDLQEEDTSLIFSTKFGIIKKSKLGDYASILKKGKIALKLDDGDSLIDVQRITDNQDIMIVTANGQAIRINAKKVRQMGRVSPVSYTHLDVYKRQAISLQVMKI